MSKLPRFLPITPLEVRIALQDPWPPASTKRRTTVFAWLSFRHRSIVALSPKCGTGTSQTQPRKNSSAALKCYEEQSQGKKKVEAYKHVKGFGLSAKFTKSLSVPHKRTPEGLAESMPSQPQVLVLGEVHNKIANPKVVSRLQNI